MVFTSILVSIAIAQTKPAAVPAAIVAKTAGATPIEASLELDADALSLENDRKLGLGFYPSSVKLTSERPTGVIKEPAYRTAPQYGAVRIGNGPRSGIYFALDEAKGQQGRIYLDANANGDLTDDGSPEWTTVKDLEGVTYYERAFKVRASWGDALNESESASYSLLLYRRQGDPQVNYTRLAARTGSFKIGSKDYRILLADNQSDALYAVPRAGDRTRKPVLLILNPDEGPKAQRFDLSRPFKIEGAWYEGFPSLSGDKLTLQPSAKPGDLRATVAEKRPTLKARGEAAPNFEAQTPDGKPIRLSDFRGKIVLLDFWATWCGPCQASMPGLEKIYEKVRDQGVVAFSVNVFDAKDPFEQWIAKNSGSKYSFTFGFDPGGHDSAKSIAASKYGVSGIPTLFVVDRKGRVADVIIGSGNESKIVDALKALKVEVQE